MADPKKPRTGNKLIKHNSGYVEVDPTGSAVDFYTPEEAKLYLTPEKPASTLLPGPNPTGKVDVIKQDTWADYLKEKFRAYGAPVVKGLSQEGGATAGAGAGFAVGGPIGAGIGAVAGSSGAAALYDYLGNLLNPSIFGGTNFDEKTKYSYPIEGAVDRGLNLVPKALAAAIPRYVRTAAAMKAAGSKGALASTLANSTIKPEVLDALKSQAKFGDQLNPTLDQMQGGMAKWIVDHYGSEASLLERNKGQGAVIEKQINETLTDLYGKPASRETGNKEITKNLEKQVKERMEKLQKLEDERFDLFRKHANLNTTTVDVPNSPNLQGSTQYSGSTTTIQNPPIPGTPATPKNPNLPYYAQSGTAATPPTPVAPTVVNNAPFSGPNAGGGMYAINKETIQAPVYLNATPAVAAGYLKTIDKLIADETRLGFPSGPIRMKNLEKLKEVAEWITSGPRESGTGKLVLPYEMVKPLRIAAYGDPALNKFGKALYADSMQSFEKYPNAGDVIPAYKRAGQVTKLIEDTNTPTIQHQIGLGGNTEDVLTTALQTGTDAKKYLTLGGTRQEGATAFMREAFKNAQSDTGVWNPQRVRDFLREKSEVYKTFVDANQRNQIDYLLRRMDIADQPSSKTGKTALAFRAGYGTLTLASALLGSNIPAAGLGLAGITVGSFGAGHALSNAILDPVVSRALVGLSQVPPNTPAALKFTEQVLRSKYTQGMRMMLTIPVGKSGHSELVPAEVKNGKVVALEPTASTPQ